MIVLQLSVDEVNALLSVLGQLPNQSGTFPLLAKIKQQGDAQLAALQAAPPVAEPAEVAA
jgi:hypothetical protein